LRQEALFSQLDAAVTAFHGAMAAIAATLASWFGANAGELSNVLPNLAGEAQAKAVTVRL
jgi:uncharacterized protein (DUF1501 family)